MICVSIGECTFDEASRAIGKYGLLEIRLDLCELTTTEIKALFGAHPNLIAACRPGTHGVEDAAALLKIAIGAGAAFVDIGHDLPQRHRDDLRQTAVNNSCKIIHSYHNYSETPGAASLHEIYNKLIKTDPYIIKIATMARSQEDCARLLSLYDYRRKAGPALIAIGMGIRGRVTRIAAPLLGAPFTYASIAENSETSGGQLGVDAMQEVYKLLLS